MNNGTHKKITTGLIALVMVTAMFGVCLYSDDEEVSESDALFGVDDAIIIAIGYGFIMGAITGYVAGSLVSGSDDDGDNGDISRTNEASAISDQVAVALAFYDNALENYAQIWSLTAEHWIRASELAAAYEWSEDSDYDVETIMTDSGAYYNSAYMMVNAVDQMNLFFDSISERVSEWSDYDSYSDQITMAYSYGSETFGSSSDWNGYVTSVVNVDSGSDYDLVYIAGGTVYVFGGSATITATDGTTYTLSEGSNDLDSITGFESGYYTLEDDRQYAGTQIIPVVGSVHSAEVTGGIVMEADGEYKLAYYDSDEEEMIVDGVGYSDFSISVIPDSGTTSSCDIIGMFSYYTSMIQSIYDTMREANTSAQAVWTIYDECGSVCEYLTTLSVPDFYDNVEMSTAQKVVLTTLTMTEISEYYEENNGSLKTEGYTLSESSLSLYCRGDIYYYDGDGDKVLLYEDVIFTPYFYQSDTTLSLGAQETDQYGIVAVWADGEALSTWDYTTDTCSLLSVTSGYYFDISEMYYDSESVTTVDLDIAEIDYIAGTALDTDPLEEYTSGSVDWVQIAFYAMCILFMAAAVVALIAFRNPDMALKLFVLGLVCLGCGLIEPTVSAWIDEINSWWLLSIGGSNV